MLLHPYVRVAIVVLTLLALVGAFVSLFFFGKEALFAGNKHFILRNVVVKSEGWWNDKVGDLLEIVNSKPLARSERSGAPTMELKIGETNLFALELKPIRESLKSKAPSIESVELRRILPDTLRFDIIERIPRAILFDEKSGIVVDGDGFVMPKRLCVNLDKALPVIWGFDKTSPSPPKIRMGKQLEQIKPALDLISVLDSFYYKLAVRRIVMSYPGEIRMMLADPDKKRYFTVILSDEHKESPRRITYFKDSLARLDLVMKDLKDRHMDKWSTISLVYEGQVVVK